MTTQPTPAIDIDQLRELAKAATAAPWCQPIDDEPRLLSGPSGTESLLGLTNDNEAIVWSAADANLIVAMRNSFEAMLQELEELRGMKLRTRELILDATPASDAMAEIERLTR